MRLYNRFVILMQNTLSVRTDLKLFTFNNSAKQFKFEY